MLFRDYWRTLVVVSVVRCAAATRQSAVALDYRSESTQASGVLFFCYLRVAFSTAFSMFPFPQHRPLPPAIPLSASFALVGLFPIVGGPPALLSQTRA